MSWQQGDVVGTELAEVQVLVQVVLEDEARGDGYHLGQSVLALAELDIHSQMNLFRPLRCLHGDLHDASNSFKTDGSTPLRASTDLHKHTVAVLRLAVREHEWKGLVLDHAVGTLAGGDLGVLHE